MQNNDLPAPPVSLKVSVRLWLALAGAAFLLGALSMATSSYRAGMWLGLGVWLFLGAVNLRAAFRGARYVLTLVMFPLFIGFGNGLSSGVLAPAEVVVTVLFGVGTGTAGVLMWLPATSHHFRYVRLGR
ncbi:hypothetical protein [Allokutzneria sp. NRRL B-24872]|uniref:hypothetical protein n=1 Tax=Allokutzneria sp. NRRL B-24872 TaxID=1137961 RepID=UPI000A3755EA|nr:hypothetical protein [Allokutzneria sp. NRRL B-24872]